MLRYYIINKPYLVLSQFTAPAGKEGGRKTLKDIFKVPSHVYPVGRLDSDSEGLLLLTNDTRLNHRLLHPSYNHEREYWVQVEGIMGVAALEALRSGITISIDGKPFLTRPCTAENFEREPLVPPRDPPIRIRKTIPDSWIKLVLHEGKNRQVRRMTAKLGFPTLRLIRYRIADLRLDDMQPGHIKELKRDQVYHALFDSKSGPA